MISRILNWLRPMTEEKFNRTWDDFLNDAIDNGKVEYAGPHVCLFNGVQVWVANYPYASARPHDGPEVFPSKATIERVNDAVLEAYIARGFRK